MPFRHTIPVRFGDADHAGIVYYPNFFHFFHVTFEELFIGRYGPHGYREIFDRLRVGFPTVRIECDFFRPLRFGDLFDVELRVERLGRSSATFRYVGTRRGDDAPSTDGKVVVAAIDLGTFRPVPIPDELRRFFESL